MAETSVIEAKIRGERGTRAAKRMRAQGRIPAVVYGHKQEVLAVSVDNDQIVSLVRRGAHGLLELDIEGAKESAVIKDMQWDVFGREVLHVDFARVSADEKVTLEVPITLRGTAPGIGEGGVLEHVLHSIEIECPATNIQQNVVVSVNGLHLNQSVLVKDLKFIEGVRTLADPDQVVVQVVVPTVVEEEPAAAEAPAEPEVIRREGKEEEAEG
jgi:large subunit ribosomal protein L25